MARLVKTDGTEQEVVVPTEMNSQLSVLQEAVGGYIEMVPILDPVTEKLGYVNAFCDEEGKIKGKPLNPRATIMAGRDGRFECDDYLVGDVLFVKEGEVQ